MSGSIEFKMLEREEYKLIEFLKSNNIVIISASSKTCQPEVIPDFYKKDENIFWYKAYLAERDSVDSIKMAYAKSCSHYIIEDTCEAAVIEIRRSHGDSPNARINAEMVYYKDECEIYKGEEFENLYKMLETWIRINYEIVEPIKKLSY